MTRRDRNGGQPDQHPHHHDLEEEPGHPPPREDDVQGGKDTDRVLRGVLLDWLEARQQDEDGAANEILDETVADYLVGVLTEDDLPGEEAVEVLGSYVPHQALAVDQVQSLREELWRIRRQEEEKAAATVVEAAAAAPPPASGGRGNASHHEEEGEVVEHRQHEEAAEVFLRELVPAFPRDLIRFVWAHRCHQDQTLAAQEEWECQQEAAAERERGLKEVVRARVCERYADQVVVTGQGDQRGGNKSRPIKPNKQHDKKHAGGKDRVRFRDGMVVSTKGERFVVEKDMEWDGGSRGKVITRRGKGFR